MLRFIEIFLFSRPFVRLLTCFVLGAISTLALAPFHIIWPLIITLPMLLLFVDSSKNVKQAFWVGWSFGFGHFVFGLYWISYSLLVEADKFAWLIPFAVSLLPAVVAIYIGVVTTVMFYITTSGYKRVLLFSCIWVSVEILRGFLVTGFPWNLIGYVWGESLEVLQITSVVGVYGLSFITVVVFSTAYSFFYLEGISLKFRFRVKPVAISVILLATLWGWGDYRLSKYPTEFTDINVHLVQANIDQQEKWQKDKRYGHFMKHLDMSREAVESVESGGKNYVIWSETSVPFIIEEEDKLLEILGKTFEEDVTLFTGSLRVKRDKDKMNAWNSLYIIDNGGSIIGRYDKSKLVPFGEFVPFRSYLPSFVKKITHGGTDFLSGKGAVTMDIGNGVRPFDPLICYEIIFPHYIDREAGKPPLWMLNITNDSWFGESSGPYQHLEMSRVRAIERGVPLMRVAGTGVSTIIDGYGRVLEKIKLNEEGVISGKLPTTAKGVAYSHYGLLLVCTIIIIVAIFAFILPKDRT